jgi:hypothetical protein
MRSVSRRRLTHHVGTIERLDATVATTLVEINQHALGERYERGSQ